MAKKKQTHKTRGRKTRESDVSESQMAGGFLKSIGYQLPSGSDSRGSALDVLKTIFEAAGKQHLLYLVKLRKLWFAEMDEFLSRHAFPSKITVENRFTVSTAFREALLKAEIQDDLLHAVDEVLEQNYSSMRSLQNALKKKMKRGLKKTEQQALRSHARFEAYQALLHLTVYDGSIAQAIQFDEETYLRGFQRLLPELKLGGIRCRVGELGRLRNDRVHLDELSACWEQWVPREVSRDCTPDHIHRVSGGHAVLILRVNGIGALNRLRVHPGKRRILQSLHDANPELKEVIQKVAFICDAEGNADSSPSPTAQSSHEFTTSGNDDEKPLGSPGISLRRTRPLSVSESQQRVSEIIQRLRNKGQAKQS